MLVPLLVAAAIYLVLFYAVYPLYRRYRSDIARYSQYAPLHSTLQSTTSIFDNYIPHALRPKSIKEKLGDLFVRLFLPSMWAAHNRGTWNNSRRQSVVSDDAGLFDQESGERMVGFDVNEGRVNIDERLHSQHQSRNVNAHDTDDSNRRLSRDLEEGFIDDSASETSDQEVTVGRRRLSMVSSR